MILRTYIKRWPVEYHAQSGVEAALRLREDLLASNRDLAPALERIRLIKVRTFDACVDIIADPAKWNPTTRESADHSLPYCIAAALVDGEVTMGSFVPERIMDSRLRGLMEKILVKRDPECNEQYPAGIPNDLEMVLSDGRVLRHKVTFPRGHAGNPMTDEEVERKFLSLAEPKLGRTAHRVLKTLWGLEQVEDVGTILPLLGELG
jgi:2-methylcitrate dehydratase